MNPDRSFPQPAFVPPSEIENRIKRFQELMIREDLEGVLLAQNADLFYFSGTMQPGWLYIPAEGDPVYFIRRNLERAQEESPLTQMQPFRSLKEIPALLREAGLSAPRLLGVEGDVLPAQLYLQVESFFKTSRLRDASLLIRKCRMLKSAWEIENIRQAGEILKEMIREVPSFLKPGLSELELAAAVEASLRRKGHQGLIRSRGFNQEMFYGHILSGPEGAQPSYLDSPSGGRGLGPAFGQGVGQKILRPGEPISIDYVGCFNGYHADQTRMFSLGPPPEPVIKAYQAARDIQETLVLRAQPGILCSQLYFWAEEESIKLGYGPFFMGHKAHKVSYVGHGVGLEVDELPVVGPKFDWPLEAGMVLALEPKMILPEFGMVGIENTFHITENGLELLTTGGEAFQVL
jgi:Xaa-Pro dipeptidase